MRSLDELATEICTLAGHINASNHRFLTLIAGAADGWIWVWRSMHSSSGAQGSGRSSWNVIR